jgi:hypothetical protein
LADVLRRKGPPCALIHPPIVLTFLPKYLRVVYIATGNVYALFMPSDYTIFIDISRGSISRIDMKLFQQTI